MGKDDKEKAKQEKEEKARREKEEKEREKLEKEENTKREKEEKEREKREKKEKKDQKESVPKKPATPHQPEKKIDDKPVVMKPISKPAEAKPAVKSTEKPVAKPSPAKSAPRPAEKPVAKPAPAKPAPKPAEKPVAKPAQVKPAPKPAAKPPETKLMPVKLLTIPIEAKPTPKPAAKPPETKSMPVKPLSIPIEAKPTPKPSEKPVVFKTKISMVGAKPITPLGEQKVAIPKPTTKPAEPKPVPKPVERHPSSPPLSTTGVGTQLNLPKWVPDTSIGGAADMFTKKLGSGSLKGDEDAVLFFKAMIEAIKLAQWAKKKEQKEFAKYIAEDIDQYADVAYLFEIRGWKEKYLLLFTRESIKLGEWEGKFDTPPINIGGIKVSNCVFFEMTPSKMLETMKGKMEEQLPLSSGEVTAIGSVRLAQMFGEWTQAFIKFIGQEAV